MLPNFFEIQFIMAVVSRKQRLLIFFSQVGKNRTEVLEIRDKFRYDASVKMDKED